jgi:hypothetical protein
MARRRGDGEGGGDRKRDLVAEVFAEARAKIGAARARIVNPRYLAETDWLAAHLADPGAPRLRLHDLSRSGPTPAGRSAPRTR